mmetsp:Transcript_69831/g.198143  ORF Transcript_69831/g.198143 Transcript_69831/m.198143 type:complete len:203 (+) Transcript_69831:916-1524(+)
MALVVGNLLIRIPDKPSLAIRVLDWPAVAPESFPRGVVQLNKGEDQYLVARAVIKRPRAEAPPQAACEVAAQRLDLDLPVRASCAAAAGNLQPPARSLDRDVRGGQEAILRIEAVQKSQSAHRLEAFHPPLAPVRVLDGEAVEAERGIVLVVARRIAVQRVVALVVLDIIHKLGLVLHTSHAWGHVPRDHDSGSHGLLAALP